MTGDVLYTTTMTDYINPQFSTPVMVVDYKGSDTVVSKVDFISDNGDFAANELLVTEPWEIVLHKESVLQMADAKHEK